MASLKLSDLVTKVKNIRNPKRVATIGLILAVVAILGGVGGYYYNKYQNSQKEVQRLASNPQEAAKAQLAQTIAKVGALTELPKDETPTLATVTDPSKLKDQAFFANAKAEDIVLIYPNAKKAYLYRPLTNKIIEIAPLFIGDSQKTQ